MSAKNIFLLFWFLLCLSFSVTGFAAPGAASTIPMATGAWSQTVDGVQGRLLVAPGGIINGTKLPNVYLELRNVSDLANPLNIYYGNGEGVRLEVIDSKDKRILRDNSLSFDAMVPEPYGLVLPHDSSLRFLISGYGYGIPKNGGTMLEIGTATDGVILIPNSSHQTYFLQGTFSAHSVKKVASQGEWQGILILPKVDISPLRSKP